MDLALAAHAAGEHLDVCHTLGSTAKDDSIDVVVKQGAWELPSVDDLEVAAAAAAAAMETMTAMGIQLSEDSSDLESEEGDSDDDTDEEGSDDEMEEASNSREHTSSLPAAPLEERVCVRIHFRAQEEVQEGTAQAGSNKACGMEEEAIKSAQGVEDESKIGGEDGNKSNKAAGMAGAASKSSQRVQGETNVGDAEEHVSRNDRSKQAAAKQQSMEEDGQHVQRLLLELSIITSPATAQPLLCSAPNAGPLQGPASGADGALWEATPASVDGTGKGLKEGQGEVSSSNSEKEEESSSSEEDVAEGADEPEDIDYEEMSAIIKQAYEQADEPLVVGMESMVKDLGLDPEPHMEVQLEAADRLEVAGSISAVVDGMVVVQGPANKPALVEGTVLFMEDRTPVGAVEDVFGPVLSPWYALRWASKDPMPNGLIKGAILYSTPRLTTHVLPAELYTVAQKSRVVDVVGEEEEEEVFFSDDEAEAEYLRQKAQAVPPGKKAPNPDRRRKREGNAELGAPGTGQYAVQARAPHLQQHQAANSYAKGTSNTFSAPPFHNSPIGLHIGAFSNGFSSRPDAGGGRRPRGARKPHGGHAPATNSKAGPNGGNQSAGATSRGPIFGQTPGQSPGQLPGQPFGQSPGQQFGQPPAVQPFVQSTGQPYGQLPVQQFGQDAVASSQLPAGAPSASPHGASHSPNLLSSPPGQHPYGANSRPNLSPNFSPNFGSHLPTSSQPPFSFGSQLSASANQPATFSSQPLNSPSQGWNSCIQGQNSHNQGPSMHVRAPNKPALPVAYSHSTPPSAWQQNPHSAGHVPAQHSMPLHAAQQHSTPQHPPPRHGMLHHAAPQYSMHQHTPPQHSMHHNSTPAYPQQPAQHRMHQPSSHAYPPHNRPHIPYTFPHSHGAMMTSAAHHPTGPSGGPPNFAPPQSANNQAQLMAPGMGQAAPWFNPSYPGQSGALVAANQPPYTAPTGPHGWHQ